jgi:hypothetical protein
VLICCRYGRLVSRVGHILSKTAGHSVDRGRTAATGQPSSAMLGLVENCGHGLVFANLNIFGARPSPASLCSEMSCCKKGRGRFARSGLRRLPSRPHPTLAKAALH